MNKKVVLIYSGGLDSTTLLYALLDEGYEVECLSFDYGQRHGKELESARKICDALGVPRKRIQLQQLADLLPGSSQTDLSVPVPEGHYAEESMKKTVVPNRNMVMLSIAAARALATGAGHVVFGVHSGDHAIYPDCRLEFVEAMEEAFSKCDWNKVGILAPFLYCDKAEIVVRGAGLKVPFEKTWTCYAGRELHCGKCGSCVERKEAFTRAGVSDPTEYEV